MTARSFTEAFERRTDEATRDDLPAHYFDCDKFRTYGTADVESLLEKLDGAIRWAVTLEGQNAEALALHAPEKRWQPSPDWESSWDTAEEAADAGDCPVDAVTFFVVCSHCGEIEGRQAGDDWDYLEALWPCPTARALGVAALTGSTE